MESRIDLADAGDHRSRKVSRSDLDALRTEPLRQAFGPKLVGIENDHSHPLEHREVDFGGGGGARHRREPSSGGFVELVLECLRARHGFAEAVEHDVHVVRARVLGLDDHRHSLEHAFGGADAEDACLGVVRHEMDHVL